MSHARLGATALGTLTLSAALSLSAVVVAQPPPSTPSAPAAAPVVPPATPTPAAPAAPATAPEAPAPAGNADPATPSDEEQDDEAEGENGAPDSDASAAAPTTKPSPGMLFIQSRRKAPEPLVEASAPDDGLMGSHQTHLHLSAGFRVSYLPNPGFDFFSKDNELTQLSLAFGSTVFAVGNVSFDAAALYDFGPTESTARGANTSLDVHRLSLGLEGRYHVFRRLYVFGRLAPGALRWDADISDGGADVKRVAGDWAFSADLGGGAAFEFIGEKRGKSSQARGWVLADGGYGWTSSSTLEFLPAKGEQPPARLQPLDLGELAFRGGFFRVAVVATY